MNWVRKRAITVTALAVGMLLVAACGGSGGSSSSNGSTSIGVNLPPEPDPATNGSTLAGVDSNSNSVRDDVEIQLAAKSTSKRAFDANLAIAKEYQTVLTGDAAASSASLARIQCLAGTSGNSVNSAEIAALVVNNDARRNAIRSAALNSSGGFVDPESDCR